MERNKYHSCVCEGVFLTACESVVNDRAITIPANILYNNQFHAGLSTSGCDHRFFTLFPAAFKCCVDDVMALCESKKEIRDINLSEIILSAALYY